MNLAIATAGLSVCVLGLVQAVTSRSLQKRTQRYFIAFFSLLVAYVASNLVGHLVLEVVPQMVSLFFESALSSVLTLLLLGFLLEQSGEPCWQRSAVFHIALVLWLVYIAMLVYTQFSTTIYYFDDAGGYHRGPYYPLLLVPPVCIMALDLLVLWSRQNRLTRRERLAFAVYILVPIACMVYQMFFFGLSVIVLGSSVGAMVMFLYIQNEQIEQDRLRQRELANQRASVMVLQMRPHFIYNTLMSIYSLCNQDPQRARQVTLNFTDYLRRNFNAVASDSAIPFTAELEHTRAYLAVEQAQYEDLLFVEYDTPFTRFRLPPLTLQPLVENAVKHGINPYLGPLHICVRTRKTDRGVEIVVADDGPGFDPDDDSRPHTALENIRQRLDMMCGGSMSVTPNEGGGTLVTLTIPDAAAQEAPAREEAR